MPPLPLCQNSYSVNNVLDESTQLHKLTLWIIYPWRFKSVVQMLLELCATQTIRDVRMVRLKRVPILYPALASFYPTYWYTVTLFNPFGQTKANLYGGIKIVWKIQKEKSGWIQYNILSVTLKKVLSATFLQPFFF